VRDLTAWMMKLVEDRAKGVFNAVSPVGAFTMGELITASQKESPRAGTKVTWVPEDFLARHWKQEELDLPPWAPTKGELGAVSLTSATRATKAGLRSRPLPVTVHDTLQWFQSLPAERQAKLHAGLDPQKESKTLAEWHAEKGTA
jgi:2'-hydroxyisoflavone reductase